MNQLAFALLVLCAAVHGFGGSEEKFIKKYAMMKVYESCFGPQVLKEVRKEMKEAAHKCSGFTPDFDDKYINHDIEYKPQGPLYMEKPVRVKPTKTKKPVHTADTLLLQQWAEDHRPDSSGDDLTMSQELDVSTETSEPEPDLVPVTAPTKRPIDLSKLEEAILNIGRPMAQLGHHRPGYGSAPPAQTGAFHQTANVGYYPPMYYPPPMPYPTHYPYHGYYPPGYYQPPQGPAYSPYYRGSHRSAKISKEFTQHGARGGKDMDVKAQIDAMTFHSGAKMRNITCVMQELGYLDDRLEPNYEKMIDRINKLTVSEELKKDMVEGVRFCQQFSQCVPETRKDKFQLSKELLRPMFFFRCYKHKKLESCIMKDVRDRFSATPGVNMEDNSTMSNEIRRSFKSNDLASTIFEFMYGASTEEFESFL